MKVGIFYNLERVQEETVRLLAQAIERLGGECVLFSGVEEIEGVSRLIVLGGDGTMLRVARKSAQLQIPIVGVNYGTLGFLTEFEREDVLLSANLVLDERCEQIHRTMLEVDYNGVKTHCLNEMSLLRQITPVENHHVARFSVAIDGSTAGDFTADGLIVATPTGSTAYSLSAGGNIMTPDCETFLLTPVCAFSMRSRPIAYSHKSTLTFYIPNETGTLALYGDGKYLGEVSANDTLTVRKSAQVATFLTRDKGGFFRRLTQKIN